MDDCFYIRIEIVSCYGIVVNYCIVVLMKFFWGRIVSSIFLINFFVMWEFLLIFFIIVFFIFGLVFLYWRLWVFRFYMKYFVYNCLIMFIVIFVLFIGVFYLFDVENFYCVWGFVYCFFVKVFLICVDIEGFEIFNIFNGKNFIIVVNY